MQDTRALRPNDTAAFVVDRRWFWIAVAFGIACRLVQYLWRRSYWHDEAYLVINISDGHYADAFGPLRLFQATPPVFLIAQIWIRSLLGDGEFALRLLPLLLGCASLALMAVLARRLAGPLPAIIATIMFAVSDRLIWHSVESKQYIGDVFCALVFLLVATAGAIHASRFLMLGCLAAAMVWFSHPVLFVFGGASLTVLCGTGLARTRGGVIAYLGANIIAAASFGALYWFVIRDQQYPYFYEYWSEQMVPWSTPRQLPGWFGRVGFDLFDYAYEPAGVLLYPLGIFGAVAMYRTDRRIALGLLTTPIALNLLAAALHRYPMSGTRATLYTAPALLLLSALGMETLIRHARGARWRRAARLVPTALLAFGVTMATYRLVVPRHRGHVREPVAFLLERRIADEPIYVLGETSPTEFYLRGVPIRPRIALKDVCNIADDRFWIVTGYSSSRSAWREFDAFKRSVAAIPIVERFETEGGAAFLFDRDPVAASDTGATARN